MGRNSDCFRPHPLLRGGHRQTLAACYLAAKHKLPDTTMHEVRLPDGDAVVLHENRPPAWDASAGVAMLVHGLCGCHGSRYIERTAGKLLRHGVRTFRLDLRGAGAGQQLARTGAHCGSSADLEVSIQRIGQLTNMAPLSVVGYSLGGALVLDLAASRCTAANWVSAAAVCPPIDLFAVERLLQKPLNKQYDKFFTRRLWKQVRHRANTIQGAPKVNQLTRPQLLRQFDEQFTAPLGGYESADDYYQQTSVAPRLQQITMPTKIIAADDDPVVPIEPLRDATYGPKTEFVEVAGGGHLGFIAKKSRQKDSDPDRYWLDWRIVEWVLSQHGARPTRKKPHMATADRNQTSTTD